MKGVGLLNAGCAQGERKTPDVKTTVLIASRQPEQILILWRIRKIISYFNFILSNVHPGGHKEMSSVLADQ
jgi:hypothetical protein